MMPCGLVGDCQHSGRSSFLCLQGSSVIHSAVPNISLMFFDSWSRKKTFARHFCLITCSSDRVDLQRSCKIGIILNHIFSTCGCTYLQFKDSPRIWKLNAVVWVQTDTTAHAPVTFSNCGKRHVYVFRFTWSARCLPWPTSCKSNKTKYSTGVGISWSRKRHHRKWFIWHEDRYCNWRLITWAGIAQST